MTDTAKIWCSDLMINMRIVKSIGYDVPIPRPKDHWLFRYEKGERADPDELPDTLTPRVALPPPPEVFLIVNRVIVVRERVKTLMEEFVLGRTHLHPVTILRPGHKVPAFEGPFYILNVAEHRPVFVREQSKWIRDLPNGTWITHTEKGRLNIAVRPEAPGDVDLWFHPGLLHVIFVSARLAAAIKKAKIRNFKLFPCHEVA